MRSQQHAPDSSSEVALSPTPESISPSNRASLDEVLFSGEMGFAPPGAPVVPDEVVRQTLHLDDPYPIMDLGTPAPPPASPPSPPFAPCGNVIVDTLPIEMSFPPGAGYHTPAESPLPERRSVVDGGRAYDLTSLAPGLFEMRQLPAPLASSANPEESEPAAVIEEDSPRDFHEEPPSFEPEIPFPEAVGAEDQNPAEEPAYAEESAWSEESDREEDLPQSVWSEEPDREEDLPQEEDPSLVEDSGEQATRLDDNSDSEVSLAPLPPRPVPLLAVNTGLTLAPGETASITAAQLQLVGGDACLLDVMVLSAPLHGALLRDGFALTGGDVFTQDDIDQGRLHYRHEGGAEERDSFTFATPEGEVPATIFTFLIEPTHRAPVLKGNGQLATVLDACRVADILDGLAECDNRQPAGLAVVGQSGRGQWQYALEGGSWIDLTAAHQGQALLLRDCDSLRFVPRPGWSGSIKLIYHAWDQTFGEPGEVVNLASREATGGTTAFSKASASAATTLAPPASLGEVVDPWVGAPTVAELMGDGLAVVRLAGEGMWQFSLDDGRSWRDFGAVYHGRARLLRSSDRLRFLPRRGAAGKVVLTGRLWDGRGGSAGATLSLAAHGSHGDGTPFSECVQTRTWWLGER